jgi:hypothetical protein
MNHLSEDNLIEFADGLLNPDQQKEAELHLAQCASCREELEMYRSLSVLMEKENLVMAPPAMASNVMQQVELHQHIMLRKAKSRRTAFRFTAIMFGFFALIMGLGVIMNPGDGQPFKIPAFLTNAIDYLMGMKISLNPLIIYVAVSVLILLLTERIIRSIKPKKVVA